MKVGAVYIVALSRVGDAEFITKEDYDAKGANRYRISKFDEETLLFLGNGSELYPHLFRASRNEKFVFLYGNEIWYTDAIPYNFEEIVNE